jgi:hypothetical protein
MLSPEAKRLGLNEMSRGIITACKPFCVEGQIPAIGRTEPGACRKDPAEVETDLGLAEKVLNHKSNRDLFV